MNLFEWIGSWFKSKPNTAPNLPLDEQKNTAIEKNQAKQTDRYARCFEVVLEHEGGFSNDPSDPGKETNLGVSIVMDRHALKELLGHEPSADDIKHLTKDQAGVIFKNNYWNILNLDSIDSEKICLVMFDMGVLCGVHAAARWAQQICDVTVDGEIGIQSIVAINQYGERDFCDRFLNLCDMHFHMRVVENQNLGVFLKGWLNRVSDLRSKVLGVL